MSLVALNTKDWEVPTNRWIASLSDGTTVFEDVRSGESAAWKRLGEHVRARGLSITGLRLQAHGRHVNALPVRNDAGNVQVSGYWQMKRMSKLMLNGGSLPEHQDYGIGYVQGGSVHIVWLCQDGTTQPETRPLTDEMVELGGCILNPSPEDGSSSFDLLECV